MHYGNFIVRLLEGEKIPNPPIMLLPIANRFLYGLESNTMPSVLYSCHPLNGKNCGETEKLKD
jgi:hypothetical protein